MSWVTLSQVLSWACMGTLVLLECRRNPRFMAGLISDPRRARRNQAYLAASLATMACFGPLIRWIEPWTPKVFSFAGVSLGIQLIGVFVVAEFLNWAVHYLKHRSDFFWKLHFQHHADSEFNLWLSAHTHAGEVLVSGAFMTLLVASLGLSSEASQIYLAFYSATTLYQHSSVISSLGPLDWVIVSPAYHRIHHEVGAQTNYAGRVTLFDVLFRTATWPSAHRKPQALGIGENPPEPWGFTDEWIYFLRAPKEKGKARGETLEAQGLLPLAQEVNTGTITPKALPVLLKEGNRSATLQDVV